MIEALAALLPNVSQYKIALSIFNFVRSYKLQQE